MKVIKKDLVEKLAIKMNMRKNLSNDIVTAVMEIIFDELCVGNKVSLSHIGTLLPVLHKARKSGAIMGRSPVMIPDTLRVRLMSSLMIQKKMKELQKSILMEHVSFFK